LIAFRILSPELPAPRRPTEYGAPEIWDSGEN
jgi:hypothetical protein